MSKAKNQKLKLLKMYDILRKESDEDNPLSTNELIDRLEQEDIQVKRKTLYDDIKTLNAGGYEVLCRKERSNYYYVVDRSFDTAELKVLLDAVQAAKFITEKKTKGLVNKIASLAGENRGEFLKRNVVVSGCNKHKNEHILYSIDTIDNCINNGLKVSFRYFDIDTDKNRVLRKEGKKYVVNPVSLVMSDDNYYLICYSDKYMSLANYRVDKMLDVEEVDCPITPAECAEDFNVNAYKLQALSMFTGQTAEVEIMAKSHLTGVIIDQFGHDISIEKLGDSHIKVGINVQVSPLFYSWCFIFKNDLRILSPSWVVDGIKEHLKAAEDNYKQA